MDALAIPWIQDRTAQFHDTHLTTSVVNAFHALAIDEHRASFTHIPWTRATGSTLAEDETHQGGRVEQRWFIGAHSNIGGGYDDDTLAQLPLVWFVDECRQLGLVFKPLKRGEPEIRRSPALPDCVPLAKSLSKDRPARIGDSYTQFAGGVWRNLVRGKREYRRISPPPDFEDGKVVQSLDEKLDPSVLKLLQEDARAWDGEPSYNPPNLWAYRMQEQLVTPRGLPAPPKPRYRYFERPAI